MNMVILTGNVCNMFDNDNNVRITIADNYKERTDYIKVTLFKNQADFARKYIKIGDHISVQGRVSTYESNKGETLGITAHEISFEGYKNPNKKEDKQPNEDKANNDSFSDIGTSENVSLPWENNENTVQNDNDDLAF